jgi:molybdate transport system substrate-binding protein
MTRPAFAPHALGAAAAALAAALLSLPAAPASAAELRILSAGAAKAVVGDAIPAFEKNTGHKIVVEYMPVGPIMKRLADGEQRDIVVLSEETMREAAAKGWTAAASVAEVGRVGMGVAVHETAPTPDIATPAAFKQTLLAAKSIVYVDPTRGTSGKHFASVLETLGIAAAMKPKTKIMAGGYVAEAVAKGEAELAVHQITEILPVKGIKLVGPLPAELQKITVYQAAATTQARDPAAAKAFLAYLRTPEIRALALKKGFMAEK